MDNVYFLPHQALTRLLKMTLKRVIPDEQSADLIAQLAMSQAAAEREMANRWTIFIKRNCLSCSDQPGSCVFLNHPAQDQRNGAHLAVEMRPLTCPQHTPGAPDDSSA